MKLLITNKEVLDIAFSDADQVTEMAIKESKIQTAQLKYLKPVFGDMYTAMLEDKYVDFVNEYIKPALAYYVRYGVIPDIAVKINNMGVHNLHGDYSATASNKNIEMSRIQAKDDADAFIREAIRQIEADSNMYPEYNANKNIRHKRKFNGGVIL